MKKSFLPLILLLVLSACSGNGHVTVEGTVGQAKGTTLYFELNALDGVSLIDSTVLSASGDFRFRTAAGETPEFYRLRMGRRTIALAAQKDDRIVIRTDSAAFNHDYTVEGSAASEQMRETGKLYRNLLGEYRAVSRRYDGVKDSKAVQQAVDSLMALVKAFKEEARKSVLLDPMSPAAYYTLYLQLGTLPIFSPYDKEDNKLFSAVATAWQAFYPESPRTKSLVAYTLGGLQALRNESKNDLPADVQVREVDKLHFFDIQLPNIFGENTPLSSLEGKVIMLDFTAYQTDNSAERILLLRELHNAYSRFGFEIYQVSLDPEEHFWKTSAFNLPWVCVRDRNALSSPYLSMYNVTSLPTFFLIGRDGAIAARDEMVTDLKAAIEKLLKEK